MFIYSGYILIRNPKFPLLCCCYIYTVCVYASIGIYHSVAFIICSESITIRSVFTRIIQVHLLVAAILLNIPYFEQMLSYDDTVQSLVFLGISYVAISFQFRDSVKDKKGALWLAVLSIVGGLALKMTMDSYSPKLPQNYYSILEVGRHSSPLDVRQAYKRVSKKLHPDKNPGPRAEELFQQVKVCMHFQSLI